MLQQLESLQYRPHPSQLTFHSRPERIRVVVAGRRWGKDTCALVELLRLVSACAVSPDRTEMLLPKVHAWIVAPLWAHTDLPWRWLKQNVPADMIVKKPNETNRTLELTGGVIIECKSAERPEDLVGAGLDVVCMLEAGAIASEAWDSQIRPMLASPGRWGMALISGTPRGRSNWFFRLFMQGQSGDSEVWSMQCPTWDSPLIAPSEIDTLRATMPARTFAQEIEGSFVDGEGSVFRGIQRCVLPHAREPQGRSIGGIDWGMRSDYTAMVALDESRHVIGFERIRLVTYERIVESVVDFLQRHRCWGAIAETNGVGDPLYERLALALEKTMRVAPFNTSSVTKRRVIDQLAVGIESGKVTWPETFGVLTNELEIFEYSQTASGNQRFSAPSGAHDDSVIALALANAGIEEISRKRDGALGVWIPYDTPRRYNFDYATDSQYDRGNHGY